MEGRWLLLLHQIPPRPPYFRAKVLRRLNQLGALAIKNSAYLLPATDETLEDLQWVRREIVAQGGEAWLFRTEAVAGMTDRSIEEAFREMRAPDYAVLRDEARALLDELRDAEADPGSRGADWRRLNRRWQEVRRIDFFGAPGKEEMETLMDTIDRTLRGATPREGPQPGLDELRGRTWVTRRGIKVDRIGSAWLIRRFIDPAARFEFADPAQYRHTPGEIRFDMFEGEFTHRGDQCTFEVLLAHAGIHDDALQAIAEIVHDIDMKDAKFGRAEAAGIAPLIDGIGLRHAGDERRLEEGTALFEALYARLQGEPAARP